MAKSKLVKVNEKIAENVVGGYKKIEETVVGGYKKIEETVVGGFNRMSDHFVDQIFDKGGGDSGAGQAAPCKRTAGTRASIKREKSCFRPERIARSGLCLLQKGAAQTKR